MSDQPTLTVTPDAGVGGFATVLGALKGYSLAVEYDTGWGSPAWVEGYVERVDFDFRRDEHILRVGHDDTATIDSIKVESITRAVFL